MPPRTRSEAEEVQHVDYVPTGFGPDDDEPSVWSNPDIPHTYPEVVNSNESELHWECPNPTCLEKCSIECLDACDGPEDADSTIREAIEQSGDSLTCSACSEPMFAFRSTTPK